MAEPVEIDVWHGEIAELASIGARLDVRELYDAAAPPPA